LLITHYELMFASYVGGVSRMYGDDITSSNQCEQSVKQCADRVSVGLMVRT
jgi:hypothetical protein